MAITYPRDMPSTRVSAISFEAEPQEAFAPEQGGRFVSTTLGPALWRMTLQTAPPTEVEFSKWRAWLDSLDGAAGTFWGYDVRRPMPWNYRHGYDGLKRANTSNDFLGACSFTANAALDEITSATGEPLLRLPANFTLIEGDYVAMIWLGGPANDQPRASLHRILQAATTDANGVATWPIRPRIHPSVLDALGSPFDAHLGNKDLATPVRPQCVMRVTKRDRSAEHKNRRISFEAVQHLEFP